MPEVGGPQGFQPSGQGSRPAVFCVNSNEFGIPAVAVSPEIPDGQTWVLLGADFAGHCTPIITTTYLFGYLFSAGSVAFWSGQDGMSGASSVTGLSWRGAYPYLPGERIELQASVTNLATYSACAGWGVILDYVGPIA